MAKNKITSSDFDHFLEDSDESPASLSYPSQRRENFLDKYSDKKAEKSGDKAETKPEPNLSQTSSKVVAKYKQTSSKVVAKYEQHNSKKFETGSKVVAQPVAEVIAKYKQTGSKLVAKTGFQELTGIQKNLVEIIYQSCRRNGEKISSPTSVDYLSSALQTSAGTIKNAIIRLVRKGVLSKESFKNGRGGWTQYRLLEGTYQDLLQHESDSKVIANYEQTGSKVVAQLVAQPVASSPSSSSYIINTTTTREGDGWNLISIPSSLKEIGCGSSQIQQLANLGMLNPLDVQESLEAFAYDLDAGKVRSQGSKLGFIMGILRKSGKYVSDAYLAELKTLILANEKRIHALDAIDKQQAEELLFQKAKAEFHRLSDTDKCALVPENSIAKLGNATHDRLVISALKQRLLNSAATS
jgi:predicted transcriptional regulator